MTNLPSPIPADVAAGAMFRSDFTCCVCRSRGNAVRVHHIDETSGNSALQNLVVLCAMCQDYARKSDPELVAWYRDDWLVRVIKRQNDADRAAAARIVDKVQRDEPAAADRTSAILEYVNSLPDLRRELRRRATPGWESGARTKMVIASSRYIDSLQGILMQIEGFYAPENFRDGNPHEFFSNLIASRFRWHQFHSEPEGHGTGGPVAILTSVAMVVNDVEKMVEDMAMSLVGYDDERCDEPSWRSRWRERQF